MIKINLLGRKNVASGGPFGLGDRFSSLGVSGGELNEMRPGLVRVAALLLGLYLANYIPNYIQEQKVAELQSQLDQLQTQTAALQTELAAKKDVRTQMEQLNKEEVELQRQLNAVNALQRDRGLAFRTLDNLMISMPQKVWIKAFDYKERIMSVNGACWEYFPINDFVKVVNESTQYADVNFKGITTTTVPEPVQGVPASMQSTKNFEFEFRVKSTGET